MAKNRRKLLTGSIGLNLFAVLFTLMPIVTLGTWTYTIFLSDSRQTVALSAVQSDASPRLFEEPIISVTFDDGWESNYSVAAPILSEYGIASTHYIVPGEFTRPIYISAEQALSLKNAGHEISSHTYSHYNLTTISQEEVREELDRSIEILDKLSLLDDENRTFAAPNGALDNYSKSQVKQRFALARNVNGDLATDISANDMNVRDGANRYDIIGYTVGQYTTYDQLKGALAYAKAHNAWFVPVYHQIDDSGLEYSVSPVVFEEHMKLFRDSGFKIVTMRDVLLANQEKL